MVKRTSQERLKVVILRDLGLSNKSTAQTIYKNYLENGNIDDAKRSGRPLKLTQKDQNWLRRIVKEKQQSTGRKTSCSIQQFQHENYLQRQFDEICTKRTL